MGGGLGLLVEVGLARTVREEGATGSFLGRVAIAGNPVLLQCQTFHHWPNIKPLALVG